MKYTPHLVFHLDDSIERGARVLEILQEIEPRRPKPNERTIADDPAANLTNASFAEIAAALRDTKASSCSATCGPMAMRSAARSRWGSRSSKLGKEVTVWNEEGMLEKFSFLPGGELVDPAA